MFKASIFLVAAALITLAYGWVSGINVVLYASIGFSALAGLALLASTISDRKKYPRKDGKSTAEQARDPRAEPRQPLRWDPERGWDEQAAAQGYPPGQPPPPPSREAPPPERTFHWSEEGRLAEGPPRAEAPPAPPEAPEGETGDFRSRLASALSATDYERPRPPERRTAPPSTRVPSAETEQIEQQDWIRIDDLPPAGSPPDGGPAPARKPRQPRVVEAASTKATRPRGGSMRRSRQSAQADPSDAQVPGSDPAAERRPDAPPAAGDPPPSTGSRPRIRPRPPS